MNMSNNYLFYLLNKSFIRLADYLIVGTLHVLAVNSVQSLFNYYTEQLENTPTLVEIQSANKIPEKKNKDDESVDDVVSNSKENFDSLSKNAFLYNVIF